MTDQEHPVEPTAKVQNTLTAPDWPRDIYGISSGLRREIARTAGRLNGDTDKLDVFMNTLRAGAEWAHSRMKIQAEIKLKSMERAIERQEIEQANRKLDDTRSGQNETPLERRARQDANGVNGSGVNGA